MKKAQVTLFIILGIVLVLIVILISVLLPRMLQSTKIFTIEDEADKVSELVQDCLEQEADRSLILLGAQGGVIFLPQEFLTTDYSNIAYAYDKGNITFPSLDKLEEELDAGLSIFIEECVNISTESIPEVKTEILDKSVSFRLKYPLVISFNNDSLLVNKTYKYDKSIDLKKIHKTVIDLVSAQKRLGIIDYSIINKLDMPIYVYREDETNIVFLINDLDTIINDDFYKFWFASRFIPKQENVTYPTIPEEAL